VTNLSAKEIRHRHCGHASLPQWPWLSYPRLLWQYRLVQDYDFALKEQIADSGGASFSRVCMLRLIAANENVSTFTVANPDTPQHVPHLIFPAATSSDTAECTRCVLPQPEGPQNSKPVRSRRGAWLDREGC